MYFFLFLRKKGSQDRGRFMMILISYFLAFKMFGFRG